MSGVPRVGIVVVLSSALLAGCGGSEVLRAGGKVGTAARAGAEAFTPAFAMAAEVCRRRAEPDFLQHRLEGTDAWGTGIGWTKWSDTRSQAGGAPQAPGPSSRGTWKEHCARVGQSDEVLLAALRALAAYGDALHAFSTGDGIHGDDVKAVAAGAAGTASSLSTDPQTQERYAAAGSALGVLLSSLAGVLTEKVTAGETRSVLARSDGPVQAILARMADYASATEEQLGDEERLLGGVLRAVEVKMKGDPAPGPIPALTFVDFARRNEAAIRADRRTLASFRQTLRALAEAHASLAKGAATKDTATLEAASRLAAAAIRRASAEGRVLLLDGGDR